MVNIKRTYDNFSSKKENLYQADDGEPGEEPHGAPERRHLGHHVCLLVPGDLVESRGVEVDMDPVELRDPLHTPHGTIHLRADVGNIHVALSCKTKLFTNKENY